MYDIDRPILQYTIHISLLELNGIIENAETGEHAANWTVVSTFELNPSKTVSRSNDGRVRYVYMNRCKKYIIWRNFEQSDWVCLPLYSWIAIIIIM